MAVLGLCRGGDTLPYHETPGVSMAGRAQHGAVRWEIKRVFAREAERGEAPGFQWETGKAGRARRSPLAKPG